MVYRTALVYVHIPGIGYWKLARFCYVCVKFCRLQPLESPENLLPGERGYHRPLRLFGGANTAGAGLVGDSHRD